MECLDCGSAAVTERRERTAQGYRCFRCRDCGRQFNERSGGPLKRAQYPSDVIALVVLWRLRSRLTLRDLSEMFLERGFLFSHEAIRDWEAKLAPILADALRRRRHGEGGAGRRSWHVDETYLKVQGRWYYLYRAIDRDGNLVDTMLSEHRDMAAAQAFFRSARATTGVGPDHVATDRRGSYSRAIHSTLGRHVVHRTSAYKTTDWSRIIAVSKAAHDVCVGSGASLRRSASVAATTSSATSSASAPATTSTSPPPAVAGSTSATPGLRSPFSRQYRRNSPRISR